MTTADQIDYEHAPDGSPMDETDVAVRAYLSRLMTKAHGHDANWSDDKPDGMGRKLARLER